MESFTSTEGEDGTNHDFEVLYTFGYFPLQQYLIAFPAGRLQTSRVTWNSKHSIMYFLFILCLCSAFLLGYDHKNKFDWIIVIGFALMLSSTVFTIIDMDRPRSGLISMDIPNEKIIELREMFK